MARSWRTGENRGCRIVPTLALWGEGEGMLATGEAANTERGGTWIISVVSGIEGVAFHIPETIASGLEEGHLHHSIDVSFRWRTCAALKLTRVPADREIRPSLETVSSNRSVSSVDIKRSKIRSPSSRPYSDSDSSLHGSAAWRALALGISPEIAEGSWSGRRLTMK